MAMESLGEKSWDVLAIALLIIAFGIAWNLTVGWIAELYHGWRFRRIARRLERVRPRVIRTERPAVILPFDRAEYERPPIGQPTTQTPWFVNGPRRDEHGVEIIQ